mmetsp:Transcript_77520/g.209119  ORF Transcript_77520/g.209119 Transcript_77520/m.209119 type:complete len:101 (+) Transcript_77520:78-380(+)
MGGQDRVVNAVFNNLVAFILNGSEGLEDLLAIDTNRMERSERTGSISFIFPHHIRITLVLSTRSKFMKPFLRDCQQSFIDIRRVSAISKNQVTIPRSIPH